MTLGTFLAVSRNSQHDQPGIDCQQVVKSQPPFFQSAGAEIFDDDVGLLDHPPKDLGALRLSQIERYTFLVARFAQPEIRIPAGTRGAEFTQGIARTWLFDFEHLGAE